MSSRNIKQKQRLLLNEIRESEKEFAAGKGRVLKELRESQNEIAEGKGKILKSLKDLR